MVIYSIIIAVLLYRQIDLSAFKRIVIEIVGTSCSVLLLFILADAFSHVITILKVPALLTIRRNYFRFLIRSDSNHAFNQFCPAYRWHIHGYDGSNLGVNPNFPAYFQCNRHKSAAFRRNDGNQP